MDIDDLLRPTRTVAILRGLPPGQAVAVAEQAWAADFGLVEVPLQDAASEDSLRAVREAAGTRPIGAGTITDVGLADRAIDLGAAVLVTPGWAPDVVRHAMTRGVAVIPGVMTPGEIIAAERLGVRTVKLFPAAALGPAFLHALRGPFPRMRFVPVGGVGIDNIAAFAEAGAWGVGIGGNLTETTSDRSWMTPFEA